MKQLLLLLMCLPSVIIAQDSDFNFYRTGGSRSFGQGLIMALDSDARNAVGDGGGTGGLTQYWIG